MWSILFLVVMGLYILGEGVIFIEGARVKFAAILLVSITIYYYIDRASSGKDIYLRKIPGLEALEEAVGRATEMGKSVLFVPGIMDMDQVETITGLNILGYVAEHTAKYETALNVPVSRAIVMEAGREICKESYLKAGRPDLYYDDMVHYISDEQFAYAASHDLQEPLRKMSSFAQRLEQRLSTNNDLDDASQFELGRITDAASRMSRMITSLLNLARINTQNLYLEKTSISAILSDVKDTLSLQIKESGAEIQLLSDLELIADKQLMHHLLQNLISNSIHYAQDGRSPIISIECVINKDQTGVVYFKDNGMGLDMDYAESIFAPFKRLSAQNPKGQGMGLSICKQIIKAHGGTIRVVSSSNEGTLFEMSLPQDMIQV